MATEEERISCGIIVSCPSVSFDEIKNRRFDTIVKDENYYRDQKKLKNRIKYWYVVRINYTWFGRLVDKVRLMPQSIRYKLRRGWRN